MSEKNLVKHFKTSDEFVIALSSNQHQLKKFQKEEKFIDQLVSGSPEPGKQGLFRGELSKEDIVKAMVKVGLVKNTDSYRGKLQIKINLKRTHQTNYWKGYSFVKLTEGNFDHTLYKVRLDDVSGLPPG